MEDNLPNGWEIKKLVQHVPVIKTGVREYRGEKFYFSTGSVSKGQILSEGKFSFKNRPARANRLAIKGDVLQARMQESKKALLIDEKLDGSLFSTGFLQFRPSENNYDSRLFHYYLSSDLFLKQRDEFASGSTQVALTDDGAENIDLVIPPPDQQTSIADKLDVLLTKFRNCQTRLDKIPLILKHLKQSIFLSACKPSNGIWEEYSLSELCDFIGGGTPTKDNSKYWNGDIPWVSPKDMKRDRIDDSQDHITEEGLRNSSARLIPRQSILFVVRGMILNHTVPVAITDKPVAINQDMKALILKDKLLSEYLFLACKAASFDILFYVKESTHGTRRIETDLLKDWKIMIPPRDSIIEIVERTKKSLRIVEDLEKKFLRTFECVNKIEQSILAKAFRGELVPQSDSENMQCKLVS